MTPKVNNQQQMQTASRYNTTADYRVRNRRTKCFLGVGGRWQCRRPQSTREAAPVHEEGAGLASVQSQLIGVVEAHGSAKLERSVKTDVADRDDKE